MLNVLGFIERKSVHFTEQKIHIIRSSGKACMRIIMELCTGFQHFQCDMKLVLQQRTLVGSNIYVVKIKQCLFFLQNLLDSNPCQQPYSDLQFLL